MNSCRIIVNADDLGVSSEVNAAVFKLMASGRVTSATMLANGSAVAVAACRSHEFPRCSFGVHLNLTEFKPLTTGFGLESILNQKGEFNSNQIREVHVGTRLREAIFQEWQAQIERLRTLGVEVSHIDSHHHVHTIPALFPVLKRIQKACGIRKVRQSMNIYAREKETHLLLLKKRFWNFALRYYQFTATTVGFTDFTTFINSASRAAAAHPIIEVMVHPGGSLYRDETKLLEGPWLEKLPFPARLISYKDLDSRIPRRVVT